MQPYLFFKKSGTGLFLIMICVAFSSLVISLSKGSTSIPIDQLLFSKNEEINAIFFQLRLPRTLAAFVCGGLLALSGVLMQLLLQNPLADPYALGVSGGAAFFALLMMVFGTSTFGLLGGAWCGSLLTILFIFFLARKHRWQSHSLLLSGIAIACGFSAGISLILLLSPNRSLRSMLFWLSGDLNGTQFPSLAIAILILGSILSYLLAPGLNILGRGEDEAKALGLNTRRYKIVLYLLSSLFTATAVTLAGCIGFIGLIVPHLTRMLVGYNHRVVIPTAILLGGSLLTLADTFARILIAPQQLPVGILMTMIGIPIFIWLLQR